MVGDSHHDIYSEYSTFLIPSFDPNNFAHSIINNAPYPPPAATTSTASETNGLGVIAISKGGQGQGQGQGGFMKLNREGEGSGDVSAALARLNFGVEDLTRQLKGEITKHHEALLFQAASLKGLGSDLSAVRRGLVEVESSVTRLRKKITVPHASLSTSLTLLTRLRRASSLARRASRFTLLVRRLEAQMLEIDNAATVDKAVLGSSIGASGTTGVERSTADKRERAMAEAALTLAEIESLLTTADETTTKEEDPEALLSIRSLKAVQINEPAVEVYRQRVVEEMESTVQRGLRDADNPLLASSLQTAHNLSVLPQLIESLVGDLTMAVAKKIKSAFDMTTLAREINGKETASSASAFVYKSRSRNEPTAATLPVWNTHFWTRMDNLMADLGEICIRVYTLEKVLQLKRDANTQTTFLDEAMGILDNKPSLMFWTALSQAFELHSRESARTSTFIQTTFSTGYLKLLRLLHAFFLKIAVHTETVYTQSQQSPEAILLLRSILPLETLYLTRSSNRLNEAVSSSFSISSSLSSSFSSRPPTAPTANEGLATARAVVNELDAARFDPLLVKAVARGAARAIENYGNKATVLVAHDHSSTSMLGPLATPSQHTNADLASSLYHLCVPLTRAQSDHAEVVREILRPSIDAIRVAYLSIANPLIMSIRREFSAIITRMHRVDYSKKLDSNAGMSSSSASAYMVDLTDKLTLVREEILGGFRVGELGKEWALELARFTVQTYVLHASIVKPLGESGKLKLTADTTSLEFAISQYLSSHGLSLASMGDQFKALRAFRPLLFLDNSQLSQSKFTSDIPSLILLHHILSRSTTIPLPHQVHGWTEAEYVRWLNEHGEDERIKLVEGVLRGWEVKMEGKKGTEEEEEFRSTLNTILKRLE